MGLSVATGEIIAYTDDDARPDPHWLYYLAHTFKTTDHVGVGGPNIAPPGDGWIAECIANAPGGPVHVLLDDEKAEHIPGCNCAFRVDFLTKIGGWDPKFRTAGDDVDVCWRLQHMGWTIGFNPAAMVWHHRRNSIRKYWKQQVGYGRAESMLERKWPEKYNAAGHLAWSGRLYGRGLTQALISFYDRIYYGRWGTAPFQSLYQRTPNTLWSLPLMPEWYFVIGLFFIFSVMGIFWPPLFPVGLALLAISIGLLVLQAMMSASRATFVGPPKSVPGLILAYFLTTLLHIIQPFARLVGRISCGLTPWRGKGNPEIAIPVPRSRSIWCESWHNPEEILSKLDSLLRMDGTIVRYGGDFDDWDLEVRGGIAAGASVQMVVEEHGAGRQLYRFRVKPRIATKCVVLLLLLILLTLNATIDYLHLGGISIVAAIGLAAMVLSFAWLILRECSAPFASVLSSLEDLDKAISSVADTAKGRQYDLQENDQAKG